MPSSDVNHVVTDAFLRAQSVTNGWAQFGPAGGASSLHQTPYSRNLGKVLFLRVREGRNREREEKGR